MTIVDTDYSDDSNNLQWVKVAYGGKTLLYCTKNLYRVDIRNLPGDILSANGREISFDGHVFKFRLPSAGTLPSNFFMSYELMNGSEWNAFIDACNGDNEKMPMINDPITDASFCYEIYDDSGLTKAVVRGMSGHPNYCGTDRNALHGSNGASRSGFRPVLEFVR